MPMIFDELSDAHVRDRVAQHGTTDLSDFLKRSSYPLAMVYRSFGAFSDDNPTVGGNLWPTSWTHRLREAGLIDAPETPDPTETSLLLRAHRLMHVGDMVRAQAYEMVADPHGLAYDDMDPMLQCATRMMLGLLLTPSPIYDRAPGDLDARCDVDDIDGLLAVIRSYPQFHRELTNLFAASTLQHKYHYAAIDEPFGHGMLRYHATYQPIELVVALDESPLSTALSTTISAVPTLLNHGQVCLGVADLQTRQVGANSPASQAAKPTRAITPLMLSWAPPETEDWESLLARVQAHTAAGLAIIGAVRPPNLTTSGYLMLGPMRYRSFHEGEVPELHFALEKPMPTSLVSDWLSCGC
ncbi:hypothetical protein ACFPVT_00905 [Corynebacterium choanae]|uniref:Uncharacterized protein n=1 Tax=Corynebacterium choanae TaxID=1862358 RepID=A0A3G6J628_9CORY|nr:hypothetical protein [Corynebacterium choanae]AZA13282.1 hypothetical protein CCHOA_04365 [Corynebacterium choanae]